MAKKDKKTLIVIFLLIISLVFFLIALLLPKEVYLERKEIPVYINVSSGTGLKVENESLDFGRVIYGASAVKRTYIENNYTFPIRVEFLAEGNVSDLLVYQNEVFLKPKEKKEIGISTIQFSDEPYGLYSGKMIITFKKDRT